MAALNYEALLFQLNAALSRWQTGEIVLADLAEAIASPLPIGLTPPELYVLAGLQRHEGRQQWVGFLVESRLRVAGKALGTMGAFARPESLPQEGDVPDEPGWQYYFHGRGCCFTHRDGTSIDVDFADDGSAVEIDPYFYSEFLSSLAQPEWCERQLKQPSAFRDAWQFELARLAEMGFVTRKPRLRLTESGRQLAESLGPLFDALNEAPSLAHDWFLCLLGDYAGAVEDLTHRSVIPAERLQQAASAQLAQRAKTLHTALHPPDDQAGFAIAALGLLGAKHAFPDARELLLHQPVSFLNLKALAILDHWGGTETTACLVEALRTHVHSPFIARLSEALHISSREKDRLRLGLIVRLAESLFRRMEPANVEPGTRALLHRAVAADCYASDETAAFLLYLLSEKEGFHKLVQNLTNRIPICRKRAACFLAIIGNDASIEALIQTAEGSAEDGGHEAACALSLIENERAQAATEHWSRRHDGYEDATGQDTEIFGQKRRTWSMSEVMRSNLRPLMLYEYQELQNQFRPLLAKWKRGV